MGLILGYSAIFSHVQTYWRTYRRIQALLRHIEPYSNIFRTLCNPWIYNRAIFRTLAHLEPELSSQTCQTCKMTRHIQVFSRIFRDIQGYWCIFSHTCRCTTRGGAGMFALLFFENRKKCPDCGKEDLD